MTLLEFCRSLIGLSTARSLRLDGDAEFAAGFWRIQVIDHRGQTHRLIHANRDGLNELLTKFGVE